MNATDQQALKQAHYTALQNFYAHVMERTGFDAIALSSGRQRFYFHDDQGPTFRPNPIMVQWLEQQHLAENCWLIITANTPPVLLFLQPEDFWHASVQAPNHMASFFTLEVFAEVQPLLRRLDELLSAGSAARKTAQIGEYEDAINKGCTLNPPNVIHALHFQRACKSEYELKIMRDASTLGARGHLAAAAAFAQGASEFEVHLAFLQNSGMNEWQLPYGNIVAQNEHASLLHYQYQERQSQPFQNSLLIDAGANSSGYASDITRTYLGPRCYSAEAADLFENLLTRMQEHQDGLIAQVAPEASYVDLQSAMHRSLAQILADTQLITCSPEEAFDRQLTVPFCPHGLGHLLGIQVHDVGGQQLDIQGHTAPPPEPYASLRLTRPLAENMVITVEPGLYFIPMLLAAKRAEQAPINWQAIDLLAPFGGIRIEDNVRILPKGSGVENLTRDAFTRTQEAQS
jgi:Xaa-Pro dipeptidase